MLSSVLFANDPLLEQIAMDAIAMDGTRVRIATTRNRQDPAVRKIQKALLIWDPKCLPKYRDDGDYGSETAAAVTRFKREYIHAEEPIYNDVGPQTVLWLDRIAMVDENHRALSSEIMLPPLIEPSPGTDAIAPDGFWIPIPKRVRRRNGMFLELDQATVTVFKQGEIYVMVIDNLGPPSHPNARAAASATAKGAATRAVDQSLKHLPDVERRILSFGVGRIAGGLVSVIGSMLDASPTVNEIHWSATIDGRPVKFVVLASEQ
jgi:peptidoglycan hydrolase-like protein with peptidoglycan-binding domain